MRVLLVALSLFTILDGADSYASPTSAMRCRGILANKIGRKNCVWTPPPVHPAAAPRLSKCLSNSSFRHYRTTELFSSGTQIEKADRDLGILVLLTVPFAWGTFEPAVRYVYAIDPPVPTLVFSLGYYLVAAVALGLASLITNDQGRKIDSLAIRGGLELGTYLFIGNWFQVIGLKTVGADRAAFLLQLTTLFVPLVQAIIRNDFNSIPQKTWGACAIALFGVFIISLDGNEGSLADNIANILTRFSQGDAFIVAAAFSYTFHCIRLEKFAQKTPAVQLAACKAITETAWTLLVLSTVFGLAHSGGGVISAKETSQEIASFFQSNERIFSDPSFSSAVLAILWTGLVTVAYTIYAQSYGQARVSPTDSNLIYTIQPICTAFFAWVLLGETLGPAGFLGGCIIGMAVYLVATDEGEES